MTILNMRLGYWTPNPDHGWNPFRRWRLFAPNHFWPGLSALFGLCFDERQGTVELSDGGHFENIGLYELIRRRLGVIVVADATADRDASFADFGVAVERARVDFGADIRFEDSETDLAGLLSGSAYAEEPKLSPTMQGQTSHTDAATTIRQCCVQTTRTLIDKYRLAERGYAIGKITYAAPAGTKGAEGILFYIKATMTKNLPADIYAYKSTNPKFPHQSTADQFFDEEQFDAYRELGYRLTKQMYDDLKKDADPTKNGKLSGEPYAEFFQ